jgi:curli biogenesis system outer membrane secretion channel CsgG
MKRTITLLFLLSITFYAVAQQKNKGQQITKTVPVAETDGGSKAQQSVGDPNKDNVAIYPFTVATGFDYEYAQSVGNAVESGFVRSTRFNVLERSRFGSLKQEERFKEVNTDNIVRVAAKFGAKYVITGHITGASTGMLYSSVDHSFIGYQTSISLSFKIIDVETGLIKVAENINIPGTGGSEALAKGNAIAEIDGITRKLIATNFPQQFKFMSIGTTDIKKKQEVLTSFKFWGGSDNGIKMDDIVEVYFLSYAVNPTTGKKVEEKNKLGIATITAVNSGSTATCEVYKPQKFGKQLLDAVKNSPELVVIEYTGGEKPPSFFDLWR